MCPTFIKTRVSFTIQTITCLVFLTGPAYMQTLPWPQFRGDNCSGLAAPGENPPTEFGPDRNLLWKTSIEAGFSSPCIADDKIFITGMDKGKNAFYLYAIDKNLGKTIWTKIVTVDQLENIHPVSSLANATPATDGKRVYVYFPSSGLLCYDLDGKENWKTSIPIPESSFGSGTSPVIADSLILLNLCNDKRDPRLSAWNKTDGSKVWSTNLNTDSLIGTEGYSTPVIYQDEFIIYRNIEIAGFSIRNGKRKWSCATYTN